RREPQRRRSPSSTTCSDARVVRNDHGAALRSWLIPPMRAARAPPTVSAGQRRRREAMNGSAEQIETVVIGAGQAGLAVGYHLAKRSREFAILDGADRIGDSWRPRWASPRLFPPAR